MKTTEIVSGGALTERHLAELVAQVDPAIGEASSVLGAMATELIRRSLRGGVLQIGRELSGYVGEQVEQQIVEKRPLIEKAAAETATEVARGEVEAVRQAATEQGEQLAARIEDASRQAHEKIETVAKAVDDTARQSSEATTSLAQTLQTEVASVETRTLDAARKEFTQEIEAFKERARQATTKIKDRLDQLDATSARLADLHSALKRELLDTWLSHERELLDKIHELRRTNQSLAERLTELEKPRGLRRLFAWLFGRNKKTPPPEPAAAVQDHPERPSQT
jgi:chromosome segregation ATPase